MNNILQFKMKRILNYGKLLLLFSIVLIVGNQPVEAHINTLQQIIKEKKVSLNFKDKSITDILSEIQKQSSVEFGFTEDANPEKMGLFSIWVKNVTVKEALETLFGKTVYSYKITDNRILIDKKTSKTPLIEERRKQIKGKVVNSADNKPIPGATIIVTGTSNGAISEENGDFILNAPLHSEIEVNYVGFKPVTLKLSSDNIIIKMEISSMEVDEVVVNGYYSRNKESMTGSVTVIKAEDLKKISPTNIFRALEAFEPSFQVVENKEAGSNPNNVPNILIRGKSSFEGNSTTPLFIMDGYEVSLETVFDYDIERIKTITILKDASATAVYGSRAANGVVVIETKVPEYGKLSVSYSFNATIEAPDLRDYNLMNAREKLEYEVLANVYQGNSITDQNKKDELYQSRYREVLRGVDTYWLSKPLETAFKHTHSLSLGGGNEKSRYGLSANYGTTPGVMKGSTRDRLGLNFTWTYMVSNKIRIGNSLSVSQNTSKNSPYGNFSQYTSVNQYERSHNENGQLITTLSNGKLNPLYNASLNNIDDATTTSYTDNFDVEWTITKGLRVTGRMSYTYGTGETTNFRSPKSSEFLQKPTNERGIHRASYDSNNSLDGNIVINYYTLFAEKHSFSVSAGGNIQSSKRSIKSFSAQGFMADHLSNIDFATQYEKDTKPSGSVTKERMVGLFANAAYAFDNKYMVDFSYRTDGSSKFGKEDRFAPFWSVGAAWNIHNESFFKEGGWLTTAKIRGSVGYTGTVNFAAFQSQTIYFYRTENVYMHGIGADIEALGNDNLKWQRKLSYNLGADFDIYKGLFSFTADVYTEKTKDLLIGMAIPPSLGFSEYQENLGEMSGKGYEVSVRAQVLRNNKRDLYWSLGFGTGASENKVDKISNALAKYNEKANADDPTTDEDDLKNTKPTPLIEEGESLDALKAVRSLGIDPQTGKEVFVKRDGSYTTIWDYNDKVVVGSTTPKFRGSLSSFFSFKGISVNMSFNFQMGAKTYNQTLASRVEGMNPVDNGDRRAFTDRWKEVGDRTFFKGISLNENTSMVTTRFVQDYNFFNIGSLSLGYTLKTEWCKKVGFNGVRVNFNMADIARFSTVKEERGLSYPYAKQFTFTLAVQL